MSTQLLASLEVTQARKAGLCRVCGRPIRMCHLHDLCFDEDSALAPVHVVTRDGQEFAHEACLEVNA